MDREKAIKLYARSVTYDGAEGWIGFIYKQQVQLPSMKVDGSMQPLSNQALSPQHTQVLVSSIMNDKQRGEFEETQEV